MRKLLVIAMLLTGVSTCAVAENKNESENKTVASELVEKDVATAVLDDIDPVVSSSFYYFNEEEQIFLVECGTRFIRVRNVEDGKLVQTLSIYLHKEAGTWVEDADCVIFNPSDGRFYPAKREFRKGNLVYRGAKLYQATSLRKIREVEDGLGLVL